MKTATATCKPILFSGPLHDRCRRRGIDCLLQEALGRLAGSDRVLRREGDGEVHGRVLPVQGSPLANGPTDPENPEP